MTVPKRRLSLALKITCVAAAFVLPLSVLLHLVVANINEFIYFAQWELKGDAYQRPLEKLLDDVQRHHILVRTGAPAAEIDQVQARVDRACAELEGVDRQVGVDLQFTTDGLGKRKREECRPENLKEQWAAVGQARADGKLPDDVDGIYAKVVTTIRTMITHAGDTSNLILDPDLDSYYLMDVTLLALPQIQERQAKLILLGQELLGQKKLTVEQRIQLAVQAAFLEADLERIVASAQTALNEDANFYGESPSLKAKLTPAVAVYKESVGRFIELTRKAGDPDAARVTPEEHRASGLGAHDESFQLWTICANELDVLLDVRIASYKARRTWSLIAAAGAVVVACLLAFATTLSIIRPLTKLVRVLGPGATLLSSSVDRISEASRQEHSTPEEASIICEELNAHVEDMRNSVHELESLVHGITKLQSELRGAGQEEFTHA